MVWERLELALTRRAVHDKLVLLRLLHETGLHELGHQAVGHLAVLVLLLKQLHLLLKLLELGQLGLRLGGLLLLSELLRLNLLQGAAPFARNLKHVGGDALGV